MGYKAWKTSQPDSEDENATEDDQNDKPKKPRWKLPDISKVSEVAKRRSGMLFMLIGILVVILVHYYRPGLPMEVLALIVIAVLALSAQWSRRLLFGAAIAIPILIVLTGGWNESKKELVTKMLSPNENRVFQPADFARNRYCDDADEGKLELNSITGGKLVASNNVQPGCWGKIVTLPVIQGYDWCYGPYPLSEGKDPSQWIAFNFIGPDGTSSVVTKPIRWTDHIRTGEAGSSTFRLQGNIRGIVFWKGHLSPGGYCS